MKYCPVCEFDLRGVKTHCAICNHRVVEHHKIRVRSFVDEYIAIDIEYSDSTIIEVAAIHTRNGEIIEEFRSLIRPYQNEFGGLNPFALRVSGISRKMLEKAPPAEDVMPHFIALISSGKPILGHNVKGDISRILSKCPVPKRLHYIDTLDLISLMLPGIPNRKLATLATVLNIEGYMMHRAMEDAQLVRNCYEDLRKRSGGKVIDISQYVEICGTLPKRKLSELKPKDSSTICKDHPLHNSFCVVTGEFGILSRGEAQQAIVCHGGHVRQSVSSKTTHLIVGCDPGCTKLLDVKRRRDRGQHIEIVDEDMFIEMLDIDSSKYIAHLSRGKCATCTEEYKWAGAN